MHAYWRLVHLYILKFTFEVLLLALMRPLMRAHPGDARAVGG